MNKDVDGSIYLFQHVSKSTPLKAAKYRAKKENKLFEIDVPESDNKRKDVFGERNEKQVYQSTLIKPSLGYAVGLIRPGANELHLVPVEAIAQFRPSFQYLNKNSDQTKKVVDEDISSQSESEMPDETVKAVTMRFAGPNEEKFKKAREQSYVHLQQRQAQEEWSDMKFYTLNSDESFQARSSLICRNETRSRPLPKVDDKRKPPPTEIKKEAQMKSVDLGDDGDVMIISNVEDFLKVLS